MKRLGLITAVASVVMLLAFATPTLASPITQLPNTTGMVLEAGSQLTISWTSEGLPADAVLTLMRTEPQPDGTTSSRGLAWDLPQQGSYTVDIPTSDGWYFYHLQYYQPLPGGFMAYRSNAYDDWDDGHGWWFRVGTLGEPSITQLPALGGATFLQGQELVISWTSQYFHPDVRFTLFQEYSEPDGSADGWQIATDLPQAGSYTVTIPQATAGTEYTYYLSSAVNEWGSPTGVLSDQFNQWFVVAPPLEAITVSAPWVTPASPRPKKSAGFEATVTPTTAASELSFTLHLEHLEYVGTGKRRTLQWEPYPSVLMTWGGVLPGGIGSGGALPTRGDWRMWVSWEAANGYAAGQSDVTTFTVR